MLLIFVDLMPLEELKPSKQITLLKNEYIKHRKIFDSNVTYLSEVKKGLKIDAIILNNNSKKIMNIVNYYNKKNSTLIYDSRRSLDKKKIKNYLGVSLNFNR